MRIQSLILADPNAGDLVPGAGGVRKLRIPGLGQGKSGSYRTIYFDFSRDGEIYLIALYGKNKKANLTPMEKKAIARLVRSLKS